MKLIKILPELAQHKFNIDYATGNFSLQIIDYAQKDILKNFLLERKYNSRSGEWIFNIKGKPKSLKLASLREIFFVYEGENLISAKDELGRITKYDYQENLLIRVNYPDGSKINYVYDESRRLQKVIGRDGKIIFQNEYDELGRIIKLNGKNFFYDDQNWRTIEDEKIFYIRNRKKLVTKIIYPDGEENFDYDKNKNLIYKKNLQGEEYFYTFDGENLTQESLPDGLIKNFSYDENNNLIKIFDSKERETIFTYSTKNLVIAKSVKLNIKGWRKEFFERDIIGRILIHDINGRITNYAYDEQNPLPGLEKTPCGYKFSYRYDRCSRLLTILSELGEKIFSHNPMNKIIGDTEIFAEIYRPEKNISDSDIKIFDYGGRLIESRKKVGDKFQLTRWKCDLNDNCIERRDWRDLQEIDTATGRVQILKYEYDEQNRLTKKIDKNSITNYKYDCFDREKKQWQTKAN